MAILQADKLSKRFADRQLFSDLSFVLEEGERKGIIAPNGTGKTTLLNMIAGKESIDSGLLHFSKEVQLGYLPQRPQFNPQQGVLEACAQGFDELRAKQLLTQLELLQWDQAVGELSGGQVKRLALARTLLQEPNLLLLDEPTNHLDLQTIEWLETYLARNSAALLLITHDRYFLDRVCNRILEIDQGQAYEYAGNYSYFLEKRGERLQAQQAETERAQNLYRKELEWMRRQPQARGTKAKSRVDAFYQLQTKAQGGGSQQQVQLGSQATYLGNKIFEAVNVSKSWDEQVMLQDFSYTFSRYEKMGIIGHNGSGKTTFLRLLLGEITPDSGHFDLGETLVFGYYSQEGLQYNPNQKVIEVVQDIAEVVTTAQGKEVSASQFLNHFLFSPAQQQQYVERLSGGEKRRLHLCTVLMRNPNFLILDEPTNDLDLLTLNLLEDYLLQFRGCLIVVSHDRYFMDKVVDHLLVFHGDGKLQDFPGNYSQYRQWKAQEDKAQKEEKAAQAKPAASVKTEGDKTTPTGNKKLSYKEQREYESLEATIEALEKEKEQLENALNSGTLSPQEIQDQAQTYAQVLEQIDQKTNRWLDLAERIS